MNAEREEWVMRRWAEVKVAGGPAAFRDLALGDLDLKTVVRESHGERITAVAYNQTSPRLRSLVATVGGGQVTVYDDDYLAGRFAVVCRYEGAAAPGAAPAGRGPAPAGADAAPGAEGRRGAAMPSSRPVLPPLHREEVMTCLSWLVPPMEGLEAAGGASGSRASARAGSAALPPLPLPGDALLAVGSDAGTLRVISVAASRVLAKFSAGSAREGMEGWERTRGSRPCEAAREARPAASGGAADLPSLSPSPSPPVPLLDLAAPSPFLPARASASPCVLAASRSFETCFCLSLDALGTVALWDALRGVPLALASLPGALSLAVAGNGRDVAVAMGEEGLAGLVIDWERDDNGDGTEEAEQVERGDESGKAEKSEMGEDARSTSAGASSPHPLPTEPRPCSPLPTGLFSRHVVRARHLFAQRALFLSDDRVLVATLSGEVQVWPWPLPPPGGVRETGRSESPKSEVIGEASRRRAEKSPIEEERDAAEAEAGAEDASPPPVASRGSEDVGPLPGPLLPLGASPRPSPLAAWAIRMPSYEGAMRAWELEREKDRAESDEGKSKESAKGDGRGEAARAAESDGKEASKGETEGEQTEASGIGQESKRSDANPESDSTSTGANVEEASNVAPVARHLARAEPNAAPPSAFPPPPQQPADPAGSVPGPTPAAAPAAVAGSESPASLASDPASATTPAASLPPPHSPRSIAFAPPRFACTPDGAFVALPTEHGDASIVRVSTGEEVARVAPVRIAALPSAAAVAADGTSAFLAVGKGLLFRAEGSRCPEDDDDDDDDDGNGNDAQG